MWLLPAAPIFRIRAPLWQFQSRRKKVATSGADLALFDFFRARAALDIVAIAVDEITLSILAEIVSMLCGKQR